MYPSLRYLLINFLFFMKSLLDFKITILGRSGVTEDIRLTKTTAAQNEVALSCHRVRGLYFLAVVFEATIDGNV